MSLLMRFNWSSIFSLMSGKSINGTLNKILSWCVQITHLFRKHIPICLQLNNALSNKIWSWRKINFCLLKYIGRRSFTICSKICFSYHFSLDFSPISRIKQIVFLSFNCSIPHQYRQRRLFDKR